MNRFSVRRSLASTTIVLGLCGGCENSFTPPDVVGSYVLTSTTGAFGRSETPVSGSLTLSMNGSAERRVSYQLDTAGPPTELVAAGSYRLSDSTVHLSLRENNGRSSYVWEVVATVESGGALRLSYPRPADGTIVETYQRR